MPHFFQEQDQSEEEYEDQLYTLGVVNFKCICYSVDLDQSLFYFLGICKRCNIQFEKSTIKPMLRICKNAKCREMLNQYIEKNRKTRKQRMHILIQILCFMNVVLLAKL